jgi:branched-subunit amino acid aminotransferase/4-amino-4-deoxychorismate lyase
MEWVVINGILKDSSKAKIQVASPGIMYGWGLFETLKYSQKKLEMFDSHMRRFRSGAKVLGLEIIPSDSEIEKHCFDIIERYNKERGAIKISAVKDFDQTCLMISRRELVYDFEKYQRGFSVTFTDVARNQASNLVKIKSDNYLENLLELEKAKRAGFDEVLFLNTDGYLAEGSFANVFCFKGKTLFTPDDKCGILKGIMREAVIRIALESGFEVEEGKMTKKEFYESQEIFLTNSLMGIMPVCKLGNQKRDVFGPATRMLYEKLKNTDLTNKEAMGWIRKE